jgi:hypothetical protein
MMLQRSLMMSPADGVDILPALEDAILSFFVAGSGPAVPDNVSERCAEAKAARLAKGIRSGFPVFTPKLDTVRTFITVNVAKMLT